MKRMGDGRGGEERRGNKNILSREKREREKRRGENRSRLRISEAKRQVGSQEEEDERRGDKR